MITKTKPSMSICLAACLLAGLLCADVAFATVLTVPQKWQEQDQWCWDATSQAILQFYGVSKTQTQIAAYGTPGSANTWNYLYGVESDPPPMRYGVDCILNNFAGLTATGQGAALSKAVRDEADKFIAAGWHPVGMGHWRRPYSGDQGHHGKHCLPDGPLEWRRRNGLV